MKMHITGPSGHTTLEFDPEVEDDVRAQVDAIFAEPKGQMIYADVAGDRSQVRSLGEVPAEAEIVVVSALQGG